MSLLTARHQSIAHGMLVRAADNGAPAPKNAEIAAALGFTSVAVGARLVASLERQKLIAVQRFNSGRIVTITATGRKTAAPAAVTPHWRLRAPVPSASSSAVRESSELSPVPRRREGGDCLNVAFSGPIARSCVSLTPAPERPIPGTAPAPFSGMSVAEQPRWRMSAWLHRARTARPQRRIINVALTSEDGCQFPLWPDGAGREHRKFGVLCGKRRDGSRPYCATHAPIAYLPEPEGDAGEAAA